MRIDACSLSSVTHYFTASISEITQGHFDFVKRLFACTHFSPVPPRLLLCFGYVYTDLYLFHNDNQAEDHKILNKM